MRNARKSSNAAESPFGGCPPEILGRIFAALDARERCRVVPLLSKEMHRIHTDFLPRLEEWAFSGSDRISASAVKWFQSIAGSVKLLSIAMEDEIDDSRERETSFLPQLLCTAATSAPNLQKLEIGEFTSSKFVEPAMHSLALLSQVKELTLSSWDLKGAQQLSGLHSLQVLCLDLHLRRVTEEDAEALWFALAPQKSLRQLSTAVWDLPGVDFYAHISLLTQLRVLAVGGEASTCLDIDGDFHASFGALSQVTKLSCNIPNHALFTLPSLSLTDLSVDLEGGTSEDAFLPLLGPKTLTSLRVRYGQIEMEEFFSEAMGLLPPLRHLQINYTLGAPSFPPSVATLLRSLTSLDLSNNRLHRLPEGLSLITSLQEVDVSRNKISLEVGDVATLSALPNLRVLSLAGNMHPREGSSAGSGDAAGVLGSIARRLPDLTLRV